MQFNTEKCTVMHIGRHNPMFTYTIANKQLEAVKQEKDLGVIIAEDLKPSHHCIESYTMWIAFSDSLKEQFRPDNREPC